VNDLLFRAAGELAALVRTGQLGARELVSASLERIDQLQPQINAFTHIAHDSALATAAEIGAGDPRPFAGVPIAIKDNRPVNGMPLTMCSDLYGDFTPRHDAFVVSRLRAAGFVIVGKTALPEMGILPTTESHRNGPTRNPWALDRTPGGSSGGAAAAVAAGMVPIAHGNDGGGSTRIPAACCGLVGLKPARGRISMGPDSGQSFFSVDGVLSRTVAETAEVLDLIEGYEPGDANWAPPPPRSYVELSQREPGRMRVGLALNSPLEDVALDPVSEQAVRDAGSLLESLGHELEEIEPPWSGLDLLPDFIRTFGPMVSTGTMIGGRIAGREPNQADVEPLTWTMWERARSQDTMAYLSAHGRLESVARSIIAFLAPYDALLLPTLAQRPVPIGEINGNQTDPWQGQRRAGHFTPYTAIVNVTGLPAISLPLYHGEDGLPTAIQLVGPPGREDLLLSLSTQLERSQPWADRRPPFAVAALSRR
jgi:amidase